MDEPQDSAPEIRAPSWASRVRKVRFLELFEKYRRKVVHHQTDLPFPPTERKPLSLERLAFETRAWMRLGLKLFTPVCVTFMVLSLFWDWNGVILTLAVSGLIGFGTNWVAIKMLFWPRESRPVFGHGLIPSQRDDLVNKVATEVLENLINEELILRKIHETRIVSRFTGAVIAKLKQVAEDPEFQNDLRQMVLTYVGEIASDRQFRARLAARAERSLEEFAGESFRGLLVRKLKDVWRAPLIELLNREIERLDTTLDEGFGGMSELVERFPRALEARQAEIDRVLTNMVVGLVHEVDLREIIHEQLAGVDAIQLEQAFLEFSDDKLSFITLLGGIFGLIGGFLILWPVAATGVILAGIAVLWVADELIYRWQRRVRSAQPAGAQAAGAQASGAQASSAGASAEVAPSAVARPPITAALERSPSVSGPSEPLR